MSAMADRAPGGGLYALEEDGTLTRLEGPNQPRAKTRVVKRRSAPPAAPAPVEDEQPEVEVNDAEVEN
jgi:hypothetical protein